MLFTRRLRWVSAALSTVRARNFLPVRKFQAAPTFHKRPDQACRVSIVRRMPSVREANSQSQPVMFDRVQKSVRRLSKSCFLTVAESVWRGPTSLLPE